MSPFASNLDADDLETAFVRPAAVWGAAGSVLWGEPTDTVRGRLARFCVSASLSLTHQALCQFNATLCGSGPRSKSFYVNHSLGPVVLRAVNDADSCATSRCSGHGTCWGGDGAVGLGGGLRVAPACDCDSGFSGKTCSEHESGRSAGAAARATRLKSDDMRTRNAVAALLTGGKLAARIRSPHVAGTEHGTTMQPKQ